MTRTEWNATDRKTLGNNAWNPHAKYFRAFSDPAVTAVVAFDRPTTGLWQRITVRLADGRVVERKVTF